MQTLEFKFSSYTMKIAATKLQMLTEIWDLTDDTLDFFRKLLSTSAYMALPPHLIMHLCVSFYSAAFGNLNTKFIGNIHLFSREWWNLCLL